MSTTTQEVQGAGGKHGRSVWQVRLIDHGKRWATLYLLMLPTLAGMLVFNYYPKFTAIKYSFYRWDGGTAIEEFRGIQNYIELFTADPLFWQTFRLVGILLIANLIKMWPCIFAAIVLHRLKSEKWQYIYRVLFVIPMVIPSLVWLLIWKSFYDPSVGLLNAILNRTGLMHVLQRLDVFMPKLASGMTPIHTYVLNPLFGSVWGLALAGVILLSLKWGLGNVLKWWMWWLLLLVGALLVWTPVRLAVTLALLVVVSELLRRSFRGQTVMMWTALASIVTTFLIVLLSCVWVEPTGAFDAGAPAWLGHTKLIIPSVLFWGFPYVGTIGVLIYLAGLQNISQDVYEAAELDGIGAVGKLFRIELPLILTQVRINLIFMTIGTLNDYGMFLLLLGPTGGPGNKGMVPGLYMYREAFYNQRFGYACSLGMVLFVLILFITIFYQKYVKVEK